MIYSEENLRQYVNQCDTITDLVKIIRKKDTVSPSSIDLVSKKLKRYGIDTSHFVGSAKTHKNLLKRKKHYSFHLVYDENAKTRTSRSVLLQAIKDEGSLAYACECCGNNGSYNDKPLKLHIDHKDGNWKNNLISNLRFLCPNCHSQTDNFGYTGVVKY